MTLDMTLSLKPVLKIQTPFNDDDDDDEEEEEEDGEGGGGGALRRSNLTETILFVVFACFPCYSRDL